MQPRSTGLLFLVALALAAFIYFHEYRGAEQRREAEAQGRRFFRSLSADQIDRVALRTSDDVEVEIERAAGGWQIVSPVLFPADGIELDAMASTLAGLASESEIEDAHEASVYGLADGAKLVRFGSGEAGYTLRIGKPTPIGESRYVSLGETAADVAATGVFVLPRWRVSAFESRFDALRDRSVLDLDRGGVEGVRVAWPGGAVALARESEGWFIRSPESLNGQPADVSVIDGLISELSLLRAEGFIDLERDDASSPDAARWLEGFETPALDVTFAIAARDDLPAREVRFTQSAASESGDAIVRGRDGRTLYRVASAKLADLPKSLFAYRFKQLARFRLSDADAFELVFDASRESDASEAEVVRVERRDGSWVPLGTAWKPGAASQFVAEFARLDGAAVFAEALGEQELTALGLSPPRVVLRAFGGSRDADEGDEEGEGAAPPVLAEVHLGVRGPSGNIIAREAKSDTLYRLDRALEDQIPTSLEAFRERFLDTPDAVAEPEPAS